MKKFIFALLMFVFTSFAFASPPLVETKQKSEKIEFVKQVIGEVAVVTVIESVSFYKAYSERKVQSNQDLFISQPYCPEQKINFNPIPITNITKEWHYIIDKRNLARIHNNRNFDL
jgi:hypothetical protein